MTIYPEEQEQTIENYHCDGDEEVRPAVHDELTQDLWKALIETVPHN